MATAGFTQRDARSQRETKYTQGFVFEHDYTRAVVERSCAAVAALLQEVFTATEKTVFQQACEQKSLQQQQRTFEMLADIVQSRRLLESAVMTAVACAYADMFESGRDEMAKEVHSRIARLETRQCEDMDLPGLLRVTQVIEESTNRNRPLLVHLSAQLAALFIKPTPGKPSAHIECNPLSPATLISGFVAGLQCVEMDIAAKQLLFGVFEREFLARLSVLINSVISRLEMEDLVVNRAAGFDEKNPGPIARLLDKKPMHDLRSLQVCADRLHKA